MVTSRPDSENTYVTVKLPNDARVLVAATPMHDPERDYAEKDVVDLQREFRLDEVGKAVRGVAALVTDALEEIGPDKASVEFGLEVALESGQLTAMLVKGSAKANLKITLEWASNSSTHSQPIKSEPGSDR